LLSSIKRGTQLKKASERAQADAPAAAADTGGDLFGDLLSSLSRRRAGLKAAEPVPPAEEDGLAAKLAMAMSMRRSALPADDDDDDDDSDWSNDDNDEDRRSSVVSAPPAGSMRFTDSRADESASVRRRSPTLALEKNVSQKFDSGKIKLRLKRTFVSHQHMLV
jgi:hypothetical protein